MAHFIGYVKGNHQESSRLSTANEGIRVKACGWDLGADVTMTNNKHGDVVEIFLTSGSSGEGKRKHIGTFIRKDLEENNGKV